MIDHALADAELDAPFKAGGDDTTPEIDPVANGCRGVVQRALRSNAPALPSHYDRFIAAADHVIRARAISPDEAGSLAELLR